MTHSLLLAAALLAGASSLANAETIGSSGGPAGGVFMSSYANQAPRFDQRAAPSAQFAQSPATDDVQTTASTRRGAAVQRRSR